jgi:TolB-like protein/class 3 adenylate cyclase/tetratricopeptide (TPR) repeat protein
MERRLSAILAADVVGYSALMEQDEAGTFDRLRAHRKELFEPEIEKHHGRVFKLTGDGLFAEFASVVDAVECAVALQRGLAERNANVSQDQRIDVRIGINLGEVIVEGEDRLGEGVNIAARLEQLAEPGGICVSGKVTKEVEKKLAFGFVPMGEQKVKNINEPIPVFKVKLDGIPRRTAAKRRAASSWTWPVIFALVAIAALSSFSLYRSDLLSTPRVPGTFPSVAVLPFEDLSPDKRLAYLGDGVAEDIITMLSRFPDLKVVSRTSSFNYKGKSTDVRQIGKELDVGYVLEGSVRKEGDKARITAQLIDAKSGEHVWADRFDKTGPDPWALQDEVTGNIVGTLTGEKGTVRQADYRQAWGKDTTALDEYDYYLRGHDQLMMFTKEGTERAGEIWRDGLSKYPGSPLLTVKLGWYHNNRAANFFSDDPPSDFRQAAVLGRQVLANQHLSPQVARLAHWLMSWALVQEKNFDGAITEAERAKALAPFDAFMLSDLSVVVTQAGQPQKAREWLDTVGGRDPALGWFSNYGKGLAFLATGDFQHAVEPLQQTDFSDAPLLLAIAYVRLNRLVDAQAQVARMLKANPSITQKSWRQGYSFRDQGVLDGFVADLAKAGLPEKQV